jgi:pilus assembly protein CpaB
MKLRPVLMVAVSLALAGAAAVSANRWMTSRLAGAGGEKEGSAVVAAAAEIPFGTKIDSTLVKVVELPPESVPEGAFVDAEQVIGRVAASTLYKGEVLLSGRVVEHVGGSALAAVVEEGQRAITVRVNDVVGVAGFLLPGNRVDVIATRRKTNGERGTASRTLLQNLKVLAVDQTASPDKNEPVIVRAVTLQAGPQEAEQIAQATQEGQVQLTLRNPLDGARSSGELAQAETGAEEPTARPAIDRTLVVQVIRGTDMSSASFGATRQADVDFAR